MREKTIKDCIPGDPDLHEFRHWRDEGLAVRGFSRWNEVRAKAGSVFTTGAETPGPATKRWWYLLDYADVRATFMAPETFSSASPHPSPSTQKLIPAGLDPPEHTKYRKLLIPPFSAKEIKRREHHIREYCRELIADFAGKGECDFARDFAYRFPTAIFVEMLGLPLENLAHYVSLAHGISATPPDEDMDGTKVKAFEAEIIAIFEDLLAQRRKEPRDDLMSYLLASEIDGAPISQSDLLAACMLLLRGGVDTVAAQLSHTFNHLAGAPALRRRIIERPEDNMRLLDEMLRYYTPGNSIRTATRDVEIGGCPIARGDRIIMPRAACHRDGKQFPDPDKFDPDRRSNNHIAFGIGIHACLGAHLARLELRVALEEWHRQIPDYRIKPGTTPRRRVSDMFVAMEQLELQWDAKPAA